MYYYITNIKGVVKMDDIFLNRYPHLDLHGYDREYAKMLTNDFIEENTILKNQVVVIIHGHGSGIVKSSVHETLKENKSVDSFKINIFNDGETIVYLKK